MSTTSTTHIDPWVRIAVATLNDELEKLVKPGIRNHVVLAMLRKRGRLMFNKGGKGYKWRVRYRRATPTPYGDMEPISQERINRWKSASLPYRAYAHGEAYSAFEKKANKGKAALFSITKEMLSAMSEDFLDYLEAQPYIDGNATATNRQWHGLESMFGTTGAAISNSPMSNPQDSYAGLRTDLDHYGQGSWSADSGKGYPTGTGDLEYHFWSPAVYDYTSTQFSATTHDWKNQARECMRYAQMYQGNLHRAEPDVWVANAELYRQLKDSLEDKERIIVNSDKELTELGFGNLNIEGIPMVSGYGITDAVVYGLKWDKMDLRCMDGQLLQKEDDDDITTLTKRLVITCWANMRFQSPCYFVKLQGSA